MDVGDGGEVLINSLGYGCTLARVRQIKKKLIQINNHMSRFHRQVTINSIFVTEN